MKVILCILGINYKNVDFKLTITNVNDTMKKRGEHIISYVRRGYNEKSFVDYLDIHYYV